MGYANILQYSEEDCGAACLASIAQHYGQFFSLNRVRAAIGTGQLGTTLLGLMQGADSLGFQARTVRVSPDILDWLDEIPLPAILHWQGNHYVVFYGKRGNQYVIADPAIGIRFVSRQILLKDWSQGVTLLLEPDPLRFAEQLGDRPQSLIRFLQPAWQYRGLLIEALVLNLFIGGFALALPLVIQVLTDDILVRGDRLLLARIGIAFVVLQGLSSSLEWIQSQLIAHFAQRLELKLVLEFSRTLLRLPLTYYESHRSGEIVSRLQDIQDINRLISKVLIRLPSRFLVALVSLGVMVLYNSALTGVAVAIALFMSCSTLVCLPTLRRKMRHLLTLEAENQGILVESFKGAMTLKTTGASPQLWDELNIRFGQLANLTFRTLQINILNRSFSGFAFGIGDIALLWFGSQWVLSGDLSIGQLLAFMALTDNFLAFIDFGIQFLDEYVRVKASVQRLSEVIDTPHEASSQGGQARAQISSSADIICADLNFHHPGRPELLKNLSVKIPGGKVTALIGPSGCGKSTLTKLITQLYSLQSGSIRVGAYRLGDLQLDNLRQQIILVPQDAHFWSRSILENFQFSLPHASFDQITKVCRIAEADEFIQQLPHGYQTILGEFGANLSGGQRQRLAIARALLFDPPILILDESTAGLDPVSEAHLLNQLLAHRQGKTTLLISHRPSVIQRADWVIFLEQGQLKFQGPLLDLQRNPGAAAKFVAR